jgi:hypothetical protein
MKLSFDSIHQLSLRVLPRLLTQVCRDPNSPMFGCFDRNWWHYKVRDFPSIILQQGAYSLWVAAKLPAFSEYEAEFKKLAVGGAMFWNKRALRYGAFEEYYPWEEGYPPLAFSTLATMKLVGDGAIQPAVLRAAATKAAKQLATRFEYQAANQQVAGLAALAWVRRNYPDLVSEETFVALSEKTLALQNKEGWFMEYDGPDLGYLSVTIDCLLDLYDATGDATYLESARRAANFIHALIGFFGGSIGMHNSRNTDYLVPYGLARLIADEINPTGEAVDCFRLLFNTASEGGHFFAAVDDRYWCHYIGHSVLRAILESGKPMPAVKNQGQPANNDFSESGYQLKHLSNAKFFLSPRKGGVFTIVKEDNWAADMGWIVSSGKTDWVNHWWGLGWNWSWEAGCCIISGKFVSHNEVLSDPWKHIILRLVSLGIGRKIIGFLKRRLIFKKNNNAIPFRRIIEFKNDSVLVRDEITNLPSGANVKRAPRSSKRHVASADSWHTEDASLNKDIRFTETLSQNDNSFSAVTEYHHTNQTKK